MFGPLGEFGEFAGQPSETVSVSPGTIDLGSQKAGTFRFDIGTANAGTVSWSVHIRALPVPIRFTGTPVGLMARGAPIQFQTKVEGDTTLSAAAVDSTGTVLRDLGSFSAKRSTQTFFWDGRDGLARDVPDGAYRIVVNSSDPSGHHSSISHAVNVDGSPPEINISTRPVRPREALSVEVSDPTSGVQSRTVTWNGQLANPLMNWGADGTGRLRPANGRLDAGVHQLSATAKNGLGQLATRRAVVRVIATPLGKPTLRVRKESIQVRALSGVSGRKQVAVLRGNLTVGRCATNSAAGKRFTCRARVSRDARGQRVRVRITARSAQTGKSHVITRTVRAR